MKRSERFFDYCRYVPRRFWEWGNWFCYRLQTEPDLRNRLGYPAAFTAAYLFVWLLLNWVGADNPWIDRVVVGGIALTALFAVLAMSYATLRWSVRGLGIWGLMSAIFLIYLSAQVVEFGVMERSPAALRNLWRAILAVSGPCLIYGYDAWTLKLLKQRREKREGTVVPDERNEAEAEI